MALWKNTLSAYGRTAKIFHWIVAVLILGMLMVGFYMSGLESSPLKFSIYSWHKSVGTLILILAMLRLSWRFINTAPAHLPSHQQWEVTLAKIVHFLLYVVMFAMPLSGWIMSSAADFHYSFFGLFEMPHIVPKNEAIFKIAREAHEYIAYTIIALVGLHIAGALKHHFLDKDETLQRVSSSKVGFKWGAVITVLIAVVFLKIFFLIYLDVTKPENSPQAPASVSVATPAPMAAPVQGGWVIDHAASSIKFSVTQYGTPFEGTFGTFDGAIIFDENNLAASSADITIDIASLKTGSDDRDANAKGAAWFDTAQFPQAHFKSSSFESKGTNQYVAHGTLSIRDATNPVDLPFTLTFSENPAGGRKAVMDGSLEIDRQAFGVGQGEWKSADVIGNTVKVTIHVDAARP